MIRREIPFGKFLVKPHDLWGRQSMLLTSGDFKKRDFNTMTVGWGSFGTMWQLPFAQAVVRPTRHTFEFMERHNSFTLCAFPREYREKLTLLGTKSGRDGDKIAEAGLTPIPSKTIDAPGFEEAELIIECRKIYWDDMQPDRFLHPSTESHYPAKDYHRIYFGEIRAVYGSDLYSA
ncbi:MAG: flavin reductase [Candidatus Eisenbacteria bacterium]|uniref:Flavin reductase n=1 Tax=Eiseniibacteriota bacterium TaxID=2212470 RepID=A0A948RV82_UNCEI|nr:flavin reductase [Candidatus Eisenbacteria bacterium]MBU1947101.1 flavin reductase [Candidatus Eisenbacteria bacterium]MBU2691485.1 flavin reductase [Candidatus Eisenbacteria bacterium]